MNYTLMHKNIRVADIEIDEDTGVIIRIGDIYAKEHLPAGVHFYNNETIDRAALNKWWTGRSIPASRMGINEALETLGVYNTELLLTKCLGLSLSDHYWVRPVDSDMTWESVNFFDNEFSDDIGDVLFGSAGMSIGFNYSSPDNTSDGNLQKRWKIIDGKRYLLKSGSAPFRQQPINEVIASIILERLGIDHIPYTLMWIDDKPYSVCENFVSKNTELVSAARLMKIRPKANDENGYLHFVNICSELGVNIVPMLDRMIVFDYIIANEDRHFGNLGLLRDADSLEIKGAAPMFDNGTSLWYDKLTSQIPSADITCKPFKKTHGEQLKLISDISWLDLSKLDGIEDEISEILSDDKIRKFIDDDRANMLVLQIRKRIDRLSEIVMTQKNSPDMSSEGDVDEAQAASYGITIK